ncbi:MAG: hypothetical protein IJM26_01445 [Lachnospiraceae bacterium]|nr:hypothetical protein [Lachnospiraceae bacterium]
MTRSQKKAAVCLVLCLILAMLCMAGANRIQTDGGKIRIETGAIASPDGDLTYKMYVPVGATEARPAPGVLLLHGYQNDHETCAAYAIELARRGAVVLCIDEFGHGKTTPGLMERGWVNHKVSVNFGEESRENGTFKEIGSTVRYKILMNFSNLSFFDEKYTKDAAGNSVKNSAEGGIEAYAWLGALPYVDDTRLAVSGHSMGTWASWSVAAAYAGAKNAAGEDISPKATVLQCGELFRKSAYDAEKYYFNNVLLLQAKYDEFSYFRDYKNTVSDELLRSELRCEFLGTTPEKAAWNQTFGDFADGSARRMELLYTNHRLTTHHAQGLAAAIDWLDEAIDLPGELPSGAQTAMGKEWLNLAALLLMIGAAMALAVILLDTPLFAAVKQPMPSRSGILRGGRWFGSAVVAMLIAGLLYPFATQLGHALVPYPDNVLRMTVGDGLMTWYLFVILFSLPMLLVGIRRARKKGRVDSWYDRGLSSQRKPDRIDLKLLILSLILAFLCAGLIYGFVALWNALYALDLRIIWPMLSTFNGMRIGQFFLYLPVFAIYFLLAQSKAYGNLRTEASYKKGFGGFLGTWLRGALVMTGGLLLIVAIEYIPFFGGIGPGADLLFSSTFGGPFMSLLILLVPQVVVYSLIGAFCYRKTGNVFLGGWLSAILACWIVTGGSSFL